MTLILKLIKKDFIIIYRYIPIFLVATMLFPAFIYDKIGYMSAIFLPFFISTVFIIYFVINMILALEDKYHGKSFLSTTPFTRNKIVVAQYFFIAVWFILCCFSYTIFAVLFSDRLEILDLVTIAGSLLIVSIFFGVYLPLLYKLGYEKVKIVTTLSVILIPYIMPAIGKIFFEKGIEFKLNIPTGMVNLFMIISAIGIYYISILVSVKIYSKKNL